ncbi:hypothetical protein ACIBJF_31170 [Streptomyces sp. NPDC050743]|uniref:hypothetical protein n=1 Tax=Streptomyces sp. NPDC050743 TaxID=3365634 RepID=UPI0037B0D9E5
MTETKTSPRKTATAAKAAPAQPATAPAATVDDFAALLQPKRVESASTVPAQVAQFVETAFESWEGGDRTWFVVSLSSPEAAEKIFRQARRYCHERETRLTFQRRKTDNANELVYRVRDKIAQKRSSAGKK